MININKKKPIIGLDFLRFFAAFSVLMFHYTYLMNGQANANHISFSVPEVSYYSSFG
jgi:peptidoglycan/LPS O-acetylase OafA/YrhL